MGQLARSFELVKASWAVLATDKQLLVFPLLSTIAVTIVSVSFLVPMFLSGIFEGGALRVGGFPIVGTIVGFVFYVAQYTVIFYFNSALVGAAMIRLDGGEPSIGDGFRIANRHIGSIVGYSLVSATVGIILRNIARRGFVARIVASMFGVTWNIATFLAVPVLVVEGVGPIEAVKRSTRLLKKTWGEQIAGNLGLGAAFAVVFVVLAAVSCGLLFVAISTQSIPFIAVVVAAFVLAALALALGLVGSSLSAIYTAAVYRYATEGEAGPMFASELVHDAFRAN